MSVRVLCVDDDPGVLFTLDVSLNGFMGAVVITAETLTNGFLSIGSADIAIIDYRLPDGSGTDLIAECYSRGIPAILCTSYYDDASVLRLAIESRAGGLLPKLPKGFSKQEARDLVGPMIEGVRQKRAEIEHRKHLAGALGRYAATNRLCLDSIEPVEDVAYRGPGRPSFSLIEGGKSAQNFVLLALTARCCASVDILGLLA